MNSLQDLLARSVETQITQVQESATPYGGQCTWRFSQSQDPVRSLIKKSDVTRKGICGILSAKWLRECSSGGLKAMIGGDTGANSRLNIPLLAQLCMAVAHDNLNDFESSSKDWLKFGPFALEELSINYVDGSTDRGAQRRDVADSTLEELKNRRHGTTILPPILALIKYSGKAGFLSNSIAHAVAARILPSGQTNYFDPNFGEFYFNNWASFLHWFRYYFRISKYDECFGHYVSIRYFKSITPQWPGQAPQLSSLPSFPQL